jgi:hypothetical protein
MERSDRIKEIIRALLAKAQGTNVAAESEAFMDKAQELMEKYQVELWELGEDDPMGVTLGAEGQAGPPSYKTMVQTSLALYYGAKPIRYMTDRNKWVIHLCGPESSRITTQLMTDYVWNQVLNVAKRVSHEMGDARNYQTCIRDVAKALTFRINRELAARKREHAKVQGSSLSLIVLDATQSWIDKNYSDLRDIHAKEKSTTFAATDAAKGISLHRQTGNGEGTLSLQ